MRKYIIILICLFLLFVLVSCNNKNSNNGSNGNDTQPEHRFYNFETVDELNTFLSQDNMLKEYDTINLPTYGYGENYIKSVEKLINNDLYVVKPKFDENCKLRNKDGFPVITLFTSELYNYPWIFYHTLIDNNEVVINIMFTDVLKDCEESLSISELIEFIYPGALNIDNKDKNQDTTCDKIYEDNIIYSKSLINKQALIFTSTKNDMVHVFFRIKNTIVRLYLKEELLETSLLQYIDFE